ncbi:MAG: metal-binding protein [Eubacterium sp.]|nr:metal-binding protein [Eubacterium sp.]
MDRIDWKNSHFSFFQHTQCEYFPCHKGIEPGSFNCLFCYCPLYALGQDCGGNPQFTKNGVKDCTHCTFPHQRDHYGSVIQRLGRVTAMAAKT